MENKFLTFIKPYLLYIDKGHFFRIPFSWLYALMAIWNLLIPVYVFYEASKRQILDGQTPAKLVIAFLLLWILIAFASWVSFQLWWDRKSKINNSSVVGDEFIATPALSHYIQTLGEWIGTWIGLVGLGAALLTIIIFSNDEYNIGRLIGFNSVFSGWMAIFTAPILGFLIIVFSRFLAEQIKALSVIANNTRTQKPAHDCIDSVYEIEEPEDKLPDEPKGNTIDELRQLKSLLDAGAITQEEFDKKKAKLL
jgi:hypothetical protein